MGWGDQLGVGAGGGKTVRFDWGQTRQGRDGKMNGSEMARRKKVGI